MNCTKRMEFDAAHRVLGHEGKCAHLHGHRYAVEVTAYADELDGIGRTVDFAVIKDNVGKWIDNRLDHGTIVNMRDTKLTSWLADNRQKFHAMNGNPTAENIAAMLHGVATSLLEPHGINRVSVVVHETPTSWSVFP